MQVQTVWEAGSERLTWRRFLLQTTLLLTILLAGGATICWVAANWPEWTRMQRLASTQGLMISVALAGCVALKRGGAAAHGARRSAGSALLGLACVTLGALLALVGQTYQTGANTATLFFMWAVLMLPWALAALSPSVWLLFIAVVNTGVMLYFKLFAFSMVFGLADALSFWQVPINLGFLATWLWFARGSTAHARTAPRLMAGLAIAAATAGVMAYHPGNTLFAPSTLIWLATVGSLWVVYRYARYDSAILAMGFVSGVALAMYALWQIDARSWELTFIASIVLFLSAGAWGGAWLRRSAAHAPLPQDEDAAWDRTQPTAQRKRATLIVGVSAVASVLWQVVFYDVLMRLQPTSVEAADGFQLPPTPVLLGWGAGLTVSLVALWLARQWLHRGAAARQQTSDAVDAAPPPAPVATPIHTDTGLTSPGVRRSVAAAVLSTASAWLSSMFLLFLLGASGAISEDYAGVWGVGLAILAIVVLKGGGTSSFMRQWAATLGFAGLLLLSVDVFFLKEGQRSAVLMLLAFTLAVYVLGRDTLLRFLTGWILAALVAWLILWMPGGSASIESALNLLMDEQGAHALSGWTLVTFALATTAVLGFLLDRRADTAWHLPLQPLGWAFALAAVALSIQSSSVALTEISLVWALNPGTAVALVLAGGLPAIAALAVMFPLRHTLPLAMRIGVPVGLFVLGLLWLPSPGITLGLTWMILGFGLRHRLLLALGTLSLIGYLVFYYYQLGVPLLQKSVWLALGGLASCLFYGLLLRAQRRDEAAAATLASTPVRPLESGVIHDTGPLNVLRRTAVRQALALGGLLLILGVVNLNVWQKEQLIAHGREVRLLLAPVDPRSLMQGDYMTLDFEATRQLQSYLAQPERPAKDDLDPARQREGYAVLTLDANNIAQFSTVQADPAPLSADQIAVRYRLTGSGIVMLTNAYFFPEGQAEHFDKSRYGVLRVDDKGNALLTGMQDADGNPL